MSRTSDRFLTEAEIAAIFGRDRAWFYRHRKALERDQGFPAPVIAKLWDPLAILAWRLSRLSPEQRALLGAPLATPMTAHAPEEAAADWASRLDQAAAHLAELDNRH